MKRAPITHKTHITRKAPAEDKVSDAVLEALEEIDSGKVEMVTYSSAEDFISQMHKELDQRKKNKLGY